MAPTVAFPSSRDLATTIATALGLLAVAIALAAMLWAAFLDSSPATRWVLLILVSGTIVLFLGLSAFVPLGYALTDDAVIVRRPLCPVRIPLADVTGLGPVELTRVMRLMGVGGFFGSWGWFTSRQLRWFRAYVTRRRGLVCLHLRSGAPVVLSPDDPAAFIAAIDQRRPPSPAVV